MLLLVGLLFSPTSANAQTIPLFHSLIDVGNGMGIKVTETISTRRNLLPLERQISLQPVYGYNKAKLDIVSVLQNGNEADYRLSDNDKTAFLEVGAADKSTSSELVTYVIIYHLSHQVALFKDYNELIWNVTGNDFSDPVENALVSIRVSDGKLLSKNAYTRLNGQIVEVPQKSIGMKLRTNNALNSGEAFFIKVSFRNHIGQTGIKRRSLESKKLSESKIFTFSANVEALANGTLSVSEKFKVFTKASAQAGTVTRKIAVKSLHPSLKAKLQVRHVISHDGLGLNYKLRKEKDYYFLEIEQPKAKFGQPIMIRYELANQIVILADRAKLTWDVIAPHQPTLISKGFIKVHHRNGVPDWSSATIKPTFSNNRGTIRVNDHSFKFSTTMEKDKRLDLRAEFPLRYFSQSYISNYRRKTPQIRLPKTKPKQEQQNAEDPGSEPFTSARQSIGLVFVFELIAMLLLGGYFLLAFFWLKRNQSLKPNSIDLRTLAPGSLGFLAAGKSNADSFVGSIADLASLGCITVKPAQKDGFVLEKLARISTFDDLVEDTRNYFRCLFSGNVKTITFTTRGSKNLDQAIKFFTQQHTSEFSAQVPSLARNLSLIGQLFGAVVFTILLGFIINENADFQDKAVTLAFGFISYLSISVAIVTMGQIFRDKQTKLIGLESSKIKTVAVGLIFVPVLIFLSPKLHLLQTGLVMLVLTGLFQLFACRPVSRTSHYADELSGLIEMIRGKERDLLNPEATEITSKAFEKLLPTAIAVGLEEEWVEQYEMTTSDDPNFRPSWYGSRRYFSPDIIKALPYSSSLG